MNEFGNRNKLKCSSNELNFSAHIWDWRDHEGAMGATACVAVNWFLPIYKSSKDWRPLAWWIHDHPPYSDLCFFPKLAAFNIN